MSILSRRRDARIPVYSAAAIRRAVRRLGESLSRDYRGREIVAVCILKGSFVFCADLIREIRVPVMVDFVRISSYGASRRSSGNVRVTKDLEMDVAGRDVVIIEDIADTGGTLRTIVAILRRKKPRSLRVCALIDKRGPGARPRADYVGFRAGPAFLVGYGLDDAERYRELKGIYRLGAGS